MHKNNIRNKLEIYTAPLPNANYGPIKLQLRASN